MNIYSKPVDQSYNRMKDFFALDSAGVSKLAIRASNPDAASLIYGDYTKWCSNLLFYPINLLRYPAFSSMLMLGTVPVATDIPVTAMERDNGYVNGYDIGEIFYDYTLSEDLRFAEYEPYTTVQLYLPYYGFASLKIADILGKYIQIKLDIDHATGQAMYTVMVSDKHIQRVPKWIFWVYDTEYYGQVRIISTYTFQLGSPVPFTSSGMVDAIRNTLSTVVKTGATIGGYAVGGFGGGAAASVVTSRKWVRNPETGRMILNRKNERTPLPESTINAQRAVESAFDASAVALNNIALNPESDKPNNNLLGLTLERNAVLIIKQCIINESNYSRLYGKPYGHTDRLKWLSGYTEISRIHIEGIPTITDEETAQLEQAISEGIILPNVTFNYFTINGKSVRYVNGMIWDDFVRSGYNTDDIFSIGTDDVINYNGNPVSLNSATVTRSDTITQSAYTSPVG